jgi:ribonucleoside-diphosphate reductase alpha chain
MPQWGTESNNEGTVKKYADILFKYAKRLRGFTCYPDGARGGQPLTPLSLDVALADEGVVHTENSFDVCDISKGGTCGS